MMYPASMGSITSTYAGTSPDLKRKDSGEYLVPWARPGTVRLGIQDVDLAMKLWEYLERDVEKFGIERES